MMNDWIVAGINNPDFTVADFHDIADMSVKNTQMLSRNDYMKSDFIKNNPMFQDDSGNFSKDKFNTYYDNRLKEYQDFSNGRYNSSLELDMFDTDRKQDSKIRDDKFMIGRILPNPDRLKIGVEGINEWSAPEMSRSEIAQMSKIYDTEKGEFKDYSPNDHALFNGKKDFGMNWLSSLFEDPLVMAQYDDDGTHIDPITGLEVKHKKGDYKLNSDGTYYYETLNGRSPIGKSVLSLMDTITVDGKGINKYDFFDSDDIEKSTTGIIAKNVAALAPMFIGGPVGTAYAVALTARELAKTLPMVYGMATALLDDNATPKWMNSIAAMGSKFTGGTSEYAKQHTFSMENFGNLIADVALQWGQQKTITSAIDKLRGTKNYVKDAVEDAHKLYEAKKATMGALAAAEGEDWMNSALGRACLKKFVPQAEKSARKAGELGRDASLMYMALVSNTDVYGDMIERGATKQEAAAVALGSTLGMFAVDKTGLGEVFFDEATEESVKNARLALKHEIREATNAIYKAGSKANTPSNKILAYINKGAEIGKRFLTDYADDVKYHMGNMGEKMLTEGLEEVSEELSTDFFKSVYELAGKLGADTSVKDVGAWDNAFDRYTMNFLGGALGGGIFYGKEVFDGKSFKRDKSNEELATLIRNGYTDLVRSVLKDYKDRGKIGSTSLSGKNHDTVDGKPVWLSAKTRQESLNDVIAGLINDKINSIDAIINNNQVGLDDEALFKLMVLGESRYARYQEIAPITNYYLDFNNVINDLIAAELDLKAASKTADGSVDGLAIESDSTLRSLTPEQQSARQQNLAVLQQKVEDARNAKNLFLSGDTSLDYTRKLNFAMDPMLHSLFLEIDENQIWKNTFGDKNINDATADDMMKFMIEVEKAKKEYLKNNLTVSWDRFKQIEKIITPNLAVLAQEAPQFKQWREQFGKVMESGALNAQKLFDSHIEWKDKIEGIETDDDYLNKDTKLIHPVTGDEESDEEFALRKAERVKKIRAYNEARDAEWVLAFKDELAKVGNVVDPLTYRNLIGYRVTGSDGKTKLVNGWIPVRTRNIILDKLHYGIQDTSVRDVFRNLKNDLSNADELIETVKQSKAVAEKLKLLQLIDEFNNLKINYEDGHTSTAKEFFNVRQDEDILASDLIQNIDGTYYLADDNDAPDIKPDLESIEKLAKYSEALQLVLGKNGNDVSLTGLNATDLEINDEYLDSFNNYVEDHISGTLNEINATLSDIKNNPIYNLHQTIKSTVKNPIVDFVRTLAGLVMDGHQIPNIEEVIQKVLDDFTTVDDISSIVLDEQQIKAMNDTKDILNLINTYVYAASSTSEMNTPIGHNKVMNEYAKKHSKDIAHWDELPEIDSDYAAIYQLEMARYSIELNNWIGFSNNNNINKRAQFEKTDKALSNTLWNTIQNSLNAEAFKVKVDDKDYNLLEGIGAIDTSLADSDKTAVPLFAVEKLLYTNFQNALHDSGLSVPEFLLKSKLFDGLVSDAVKNQKTSKFDDKLDADRFTEYDKLLYLAMALTLNPVDFYTNLKSKINADTKTAPITVQEYDARLATASRNQQYRDIMLYAHDYSGDDKYAAVNTTVITGAAGAGKTLVVVKSAVLGIDAADIMAVGPTTTLASSLAKSLQVTNLSTIKDTLINILGDTTYGEIETEINSFVYDDAHKVYNKNAGKYFDIKEVNGLALVNIHPENITYKADAPKPKVLVIDEATHLNSVYALILDNYMKSIGGQLILIGDPNQRGYNNKKNYIGNIRETDMFTTRAPKLTVSLRDNNIQKQYNLSIVQALLDLVNDKVTNLSEDALNQYWPSAQNILSKFNFKVYNKEEINGDLIASSITPDIISKIKGKKNADGTNKTVGFIGDKNTSAAYKSLIDAGFKEGEDFDALSMDQMLGLEWDYVVIDEQFNKPDANISVRNFLQDLYTLMSRGKEAAIFVDNNLSDSIGNNVEENYKAKAPSLLDKVNGSSAVDDLRARKVELINQFDLTPITLKGLPAASTENTENPDLDFIDPDSLNNDSDVAEKLKQEIADEIGESVASGEVLSPEKIERTTENLALVSDITDTTASFFTVPSWGDVTYTGVLVIKDLKKVSKSNGKEYTGPKWVITHNTEGPLRNLQALYSDGTEAFWLKDKLAMQKALYDVKSTLIFQHNDWDSDALVRVPLAIRDNFKKSDWDNGTYELEIRKVDGEVLPLYASMKEAGFEYPPGSGKRYIADIVFKVKNKNGKECVFDLSGINNPTTLFKNLDLIKTNINKKISSGKLSTEKAQKLQNIHDTIDTLALKYKALFDSWIQEFDDKGQFSLNVTDAIDFNHTTWLRRRNDNIRLGGTTDPNAVTDNRNYRNLKSMNPGMVFSDIYTYSSKRNELDSLDPSIRGKAVIFASSDTLIKPENLISEYIKQKKDPENSYPSVRMIVLNNYGMSFSLFMDPEFIKTFQEGHADRKPIRLNFKGLHMFASLWNFRAGLNLFRQALLDWKTKNNYDDAKVNNIIKALDDIERKHLSRDTVITKYGITKEDLNNLETFNLEDLKNIPIYRLGYTENENGFHVQSYDVSDSTAYKKQKANLLNINPQKAELFYQLLNKIFDVIAPSQKNSTSLNLQLLKPDGTKWDESELIDIKDAKHKRSLSNLIHFDKDLGLTIELGGVRVAFTQGNAWSSIPALISSIARTVTYHLYNDDGGLTGYENAKITVHDKKNGTSHTTELLVGLWMKPDTGTEPLIKTVYTNKSAVKPDGTVVNPDKSLLNLFDLVFHGTVEDFHKGNVQLLEDAIFKQGFLIDPDAERVKNADGSDYVTVGITGDKDTLFLKLSTVDALFTSDVDLRSAGINLNIDKLMSGGPRATSGSLQIGDFIDIYTSEGERQENMIYKLEAINDTRYGRIAVLRNVVNNSTLSKNLDEILADPNKFKVSKTQPTTYTAPKSFADLYPVANKLIEMANMLGEDYEYDVSSIDDIIDYFNNLNIPVAIDRFKSTNDLTINCFYKRNGDDAQELNLLGYFQHLLGSEEFKSAKVEDGKIIINNKYVYDNGTLKENTPPPSTESKFNSKLKKDITELFNDKSFISEISDEDNPMAVDIEDYNTFCTLLFDILSNDSKKVFTAEQTNVALQLLRNTADPGLLAAVKLKNEAIYNQLFKDC